MTSKFKDIIVSNNCYKDLRKLLTKGIFNYFGVDSDLKSFKIYINNCLFCIIFIII